MLEKLTDTSFILKYSTNTSIKYCIELLLGMIFWVSKITGVSRRHIYKYMSDKAKASLAKLFIMKHDLVKSIFHTEFEKSLSTDFFYREILSHSIYETLQEKKLKETLQIILDKEKNSRLDESIDDKDQASHEVFSRKNEDKDASKKILSTTQYLIKNLYIFYSSIISNERLSK